MSGRCRACNVVMFEEELTKKWPGTDEYTDLCTHCMNISLNPDEVDDYYEHKSNDHYEE